MGWGAGPARRGPVLRTPTNEDTSEVPAGAQGWWWAQHCMSLGSCGWDVPKMLAWQRQPEPGEKEESRKGGGQMRRGDGRRYLLGTGPRPQGHISVLALLALASPLLPLCPSGLASQVPHGTLKSLPGPFNRMASKMAPVSS